MYRSDKSFMRDPATANCRIYVGGLDPTQDEAVVSEKMDEHFKKYGKIVGRVVQRNFGFIQFEEETSAQEAIKNEHGKTLLGRKLNVRPAFDNKNKQQGEETPGNSNEMPPRKVPRRGGHAGRGRGGHAGMDRDISPHKDDYR